MLLLCQHHSSFQNSLLQGIMSSRGPAQSETLCRRVQLHYSTYRYRMSWMSQSIAQSPGALFFDGVCCCWASWHMFGVMQAFAAPMSCWSCPSPSRQLFSAFAAAHGPPSIVRPLSAMRVALVVMCRVLMCLRAGIGKPCRPGQRLLLQSCGIMSGEFAHVIINSSSHSAWALHLRLELRVQS